MTERPVVGADDVRAWLGRRVGELLDVSTVPRDVAFIELGLDSPAHAQLAVELEDLTGRPVGIEELFAHPTIDELSEAITSPPPAMPVARPGGRSGSERVELLVSGMACRFPGAGSPAELWDALLGGVDAVGPVPAARQSSVGTGHEGGFIADVAGFDAAFFRVSRAEALRMDPQQRLILEVAWEALEDAGLVPSELAGSATGVFVGVSFSDYALAQLGQGAPVDAYVPTGSALSVIANRVSYLLDLRGPSVSVDTACSSSLTALHLASRALQAGDCERAVVAGVNVILGSQISAGIELAGMLAPDSRCKPFDASANGYVRSEGCGAVVVERADASPRARRRPYARLRGTAMNQDGRSNGLTAPSPGSQVEVIRAAHADGGTDPADVAYVESHGTGTSLGDTIEAASLGTVVGLGRTEPCLIGSIKGNLGHLEAAAGVAGLIKAALIASHGVVPPSLHFDRPNPHIDFDGLGLAVAASRITLAEGAARLIGVSSFGFGGTNVHAVLDVPDDGGGRAPDVSGTVLLPLSAASPESLAATIETWRVWLAGQDEATIRAAAFTAARGRTHHAYRVAVAGAPGELGTRLDRVDVAARGSAGTGSPPRVLFVFPGQGSERAGMGRSLLDREPLFASVVSRIDEARPPGARAVVELLRSGTPEDFRSTAAVQPALVAVELGLAALLRASGIAPAAVVGHSVGEIAAAHAAGVIDLDDAATLVWERGAAMAAVDAGGAMLACGLRADEAAGLVDRFDGDIEIAAVNDRRTVVLSGGRAALDRIREELSAAGTFARWVSEHHGFHCQLMAPAAVAVGVVAAGLAHHTPSVPFFSTVSGGRVDAVPSGHWAANVRETVRFADALTAALDEVDAIVEVGPAPALRSSIRQCLGDRTVPVLASLAEGGDEATELANCVGALYELGARVRWSRWHPRGEAVGVPTYRWNHQRYWFDDGAPRPAPRAVTDEDRPHPFLGRGIRFADDERAGVWESPASLAEVPYLADHRVAGAAVAPAALFVELVRAVGVELHGPGARAEHLELLTPLLLDGDVQLQTRSEPLDAHACAVTVRARTQPEGEWVEVCRAVVRPGESGPSGLAPGGDGGVEAGDEVAPDALYHSLRSVGLEYGVAFRTARQIVRGPGWARGTVAVDDGDVDDRCLLDPRLLDGAFHLLGAAAPELLSERRLVVPTAVEELISGDEGGARALDAAVVLTRLRELDRRAGRVVADIEIETVDGRAVLALRGLELRVLGGRIAAATSALHLYERVWRPADAAPRTAAGGCIVVGSGAQLQRSLEDALRADGRLVASARVGDDAIGDDAALREWLGDVASTAPDLRDVLLVDEGSAEPGGQVPRSSVALLLRLVKALSFAPLAPVPDLWIVTRDLHLVADGDVPGPPHGALAWGLARVMPFENPVLRTRCLDVTGTDDPAARDVLSELLVRGQDVEIARRHGQRFVRRVVRRPDATGELVVDPAGMYVVTGGQGGLGLAVAARLVDRGATNVALLGRRPCTDAAAALRTSAAAAGATVHVVAVDIADYDALGSALADLRGRAPIQGIVHAAGALRDGSVLDTTEHDLDVVLRGKVDGAWHLHELTRSDPLDWLVLFSSAASVLGSPGQANYCAANAFLDALAVHRRAAGLPASAINWGPWNDVGMAADRGGHRGSGTAVGGINGIAPDVGVEAMEEVIADGSAGTMVLAYDLRNLAQYYPAGIGFSTFDELLEGDDSLRNDTSSSLARRPKIEQEYVAPRTELERRVAGLWQASLGIDAVGVHDGFFELGGDSVFANQILVQLSRALEVELDPEAAFEDFTVATLAALAEAALVERVASMSEEDAARLLEELG